MAVLHMYEDIRVPLLGPIIAHLKVSLVPSVSLCTQNRSKDRVGEARYQTDLKVYFSSEYPRV